MADPQSPSAPAASRPSRSEPPSTASVVGWGLGAWAAIQFAGSLLARNATAASAAQAAIAEWAAGPMGVAWTEGRSERWPAIARRCVWGASMGSAVAVAATAAACLAHTASLGAGVPAVSPLALGLAVAVLEAIRDELLLRGVARQTARGRMPPWAALLLSGAIAAAARLGTDGPEVMAIARDALAGVAFGALWQLDRGAFMPIAAHTAWSWVGGPILHGAVFDVRFAAVSTDDVPSLLVLALAAAGAVAAALRKGRAPDAAAVARPE